MSAFALSTNNFQRAVGGNANSPSGLSPWASEMYLRNTSPRTTSLYWLAERDPRSLSAAFQSVSLSSFIVDGGSDMLAPISSPALQSHVARWPNRRGWTH